ncbi:MAG: VOC family protein [Myxococcales bacterium]|nr:VOC family protein [Myxococcales bacterium]
MRQATETASLSAFRPRVLYTAYHVQDLDKAVAFYTDVLGLQQRMRFELPSGEWECVLEYPESKGSGVILMWNPKSTGKPDLGDGYSRLVFKVSDLDAAVELLRSRDARITTPPTDTPMGLRYALFQDPDGYTIELMQLGKS